MSNDNMQDAAALAAEATVDATTDAVGYGYADTPRPTLMAVPPPPPEIAPEISDDAIANALAALEPTVGGTVAEASLEQLIGEAGAEAPEQQLAAPDGLSILAALDGATAEEASAAGSYGYDKALAEQGKWFRWPKLGPNARVKLAKVGCSAWKSAAERIRKAYANEEGVISPETMEKVLGPMMVKSVFAGMEGVVVAIGKPPVTDTVENRLRLLEEFEGLRDHLFKACNNAKNFRDNSETVLGN